MICLEQGADVLEDALKLNPDNEGIMTSLKIFMVLWVIMKTS